MRADSPTTPTRSELQVDSANAYAPTQAFFINSGAAGLPSLTDTYTVDKATGNVAIHETDPLVKCSTATYPPTTGSCATFVSTGVTDDRTITQDHDGHISWVTDVFKSTDGKAHAIDLLWDNNEQFFGASGDSSKLEYEFPGESSFSTHATGANVSLPPSAGAIFIRMHGAADGDTGTGQGAIVYDRPATAAKFTSVTTFGSEFTLHQAGKVPAGGSTRFRFAYVQDYQAALVGTRAQGRERPLPQPDHGLEVGQGHREELARGDRLRQDLHARLRLRDVGDAEGEGRQGLEVLGLVGRLQGQPRLQGHHERQRRGRGEVRPPAVRRAQPRGQDPRGGEGRDQEGVLLRGQGDRGAVRQGEGRCRLPEAEARQAAEAAREDQLSS